MFSVVPRTQPIEVLDLIWPQVNAPIDTVTPGAFSANGYNRFGGAAVAVWGGTSGAAGTMNQYREHVGGQLIAGHRSNDGLKFYPLLAKANITSPTLTQSEWQRVYRAQVYFAFVSANPTTATGICIEMGNANGALPTYPSAAGNGAGFGFQGNGAGGIQWFSKQTIAGGFTDVTAVVSNAPITEVNVFDFEIRSATQAADATIRCLINGVQVISRSWGAGTVLPDYALATAMNHMRIGVNSGAGETIFLGPNHTIAGRFTMDNVELLNALSGSI